jgi:hypothetical protein
MAPRFLISLVLAFGCACGPAEPAKNPRFDLNKPRPTPPRPTLSGPPALPSVVIAELASADSEVHFARNGERGLLVSRSGGRWLTGPVKVTASLKGAVRDDAAFNDVAAAPNEATATALRPSGDGFVLAWVNPAQAGGEIWALPLHADGKAAGEAKKVSQSYESASWVDVLSTDKGALLIWEVTKSGKHEIYATPWSKKGPGAAVTVITDAVGWQAAAGPGGAVVVWVDGEPGRVRVTEIAADGRTKGPTALGTGTTALADPQVVALTDRFLVAWTDAASADHRVLTAQVGAGATVLAEPKALFPPVGGQALVALVAADGRKRALIAWERDLGVPMATRRIELATLGGDGLLTPSRAVLEFLAPEDGPHLCADGEGFAALTLAPIATRDAENADAPAGPVFVRFDQDLGMRAAEPIRVADLKHQGVGVEGVPESVRDLSCSSGLCTVIATGNGSPALLALATLPVRATPWRAPAKQLGPAQKPLPSALASVAEADAPLADLAAARLADGRTLVVWVTHVVDESETSPPRATLAYRFVDQAGQAGPVTTLSQRAISVGGVSVAALPAGEGARQPVAVLGWAGPDGKSAQVFATLVGAGGEKLEQKTITSLIRNKKGAPPSEVFDVEVVPDGQGKFLFAWSDSRDGNPEIYVARANAQLDKSRVDQRITTAYGPSVEPQLLVLGDRVMLAWSDAPAGGGDRADVLFAQLDFKDLSPKVKAQPADESPAHSRTPRWVTGGSGPALAWIDEADETSPGALRLLALDAFGVGTTAARRVLLRGGAAVTSGVVACAGGDCRGVVAGADGALLHLGAFATARESGAPVTAEPLLTLGGGTAQDLALVGAGAAPLATVFFLQDASGGTLVRQLDVDW